MRTITIHLDGRAGVDDAVRERVRRAVAEPADRDAVLAAAAQLAGRAREVAAMNGTLSASRALGLHGVRVVLRAEVGRHGGRLGRALRRLAGLVRGSG